jgi:hypothetical protein
MNKIIFLVFATKPWDNITEGKKLRHTEMVYGVRHLVWKTAMERKRKHIWENNIKVDI